MNLNQTFIKYTLHNIDMATTIIQKDCIVCDVCNDQVSDSEFIAITNATWYDGWLYCERCDQEYKPKLQEIMPILIGDKDRKSTRLNSSHVSESRMPSSA